MQYFRITTPTLLDVREIVTLGLTSKTNKELIGHKGSGLKFALAYIHRLGGFLEAKAPGYHLRSEVETVTIRDQEHSLIRLRNGGDGQTIETNMTTHAGADTWDEPWFILRELIQNALDEKGTYEVVEEGAIPEGEGTVVQVPMSPELTKAWEERDMWFQPRYPGLISHGHPAIKGIYFHGFLAFKATSEWSFSYDATTVISRSELSEDRQLANLDLYSLFRRLCENLDFEFDSRALYRLAFVKNQTEDVARIYDGVYHIIGHNRKEWGGPNGFKLSAMQDSFLSSFGARASFTDSEVTDTDPTVYYARAAGFEPVTVPHRVSSIFSGYSTLKSVDSCLPTLRDRLKKMKSVDLTRGEKLKAALRMLKRIKPKGVRVEIVAKVLDSDTINCGALADPTNNRIMVLESLLDQDIPEIARTLIEEFAHLTSGGGDMSMPMQRALIDTIYDLLTRRRKMNVENLTT